MKRPELAKRAKIRKEDFGGILRAPVQSALKTGQTFYLLNEVEFFILSNLRAKDNSIRKIAEKVANEFNADINEVMTDISEYLKRLEEFGIVVWI